MPNLSLPDAAREWGVSRRTAYRLAEQGLVRVARILSRITIPAEEVERVRREGISEGPDAAARPVPSLPRRGRPTQRPRR
jgi:predicted site-specific integrase-resolvase